MIKIKLEDQERHLTQRKLELEIYGRDYVQVNSGTRRTPKKIALLKAIAEDAASQGRVPPFRCE